ncbi:MAG TPA: PP2C family protein-serine/threonine phosphatase, partial [Phycisphaerae bacterium]|nr:PP2C family protein-serine/threonine phosphatase [Phycisphaerae bacterium]
GFGPGMRGGPGGGGWGMGGDPNGPGPRGGFGGPGFPPPGGEEEGGPGGPGGGGGGPAMGQEDMGGGGGGGPGAAGGRQGWRELPFNGGGGGPQAGAPQLPTIDARTVVAVLSLDKVRADFFDPLNHERGAPEADANGNVPDASVVNAMLVDQKGDVLVSISGRWVGTNMMTDLDAGMRDAIAPYIQEGKKGSYVMTGDARLGKETLPARIIWFEPVDLPSGQTWTVMTMSPVADVDALVNRLFSSAFQWAVFVSVAVAGILFSSSVFMIRSRVRLERAQHEVITKELQQARNIQLAWLPGEGETPEGIDVSAVNLPASHISGDFYNWFALDGAGKGKVAVVIGDVTGHGMAAAFLMATTQLLVKVALQRTQDPGACLGIVNKQLCTQGFSGQFVTMIVVVLEPGSGAVEVATAGHPAPLLQRGGEFSVMEVVPSLVLGVDAAETYKTHGFVAEPGATMILYTDGVVEAECEDGEQYGVERLVEAVNRGAAKTGGTGRPDQRIKTIVEDVRKFCGAKDLLDDLTVVAVRVG